MSSQTAPAQGAPLSLTMAVNLFSRFFTRLLERETKFPIFLKEWESFKYQLLKDTVDLDSIFIHLAKIQLNLEKAAAPCRSENYLDGGSDQKNKQPLRTNPRHVKNPSTATRSRTPSAQKPREMVTKACELSGRRQPFLDLQAYDLSDIKNKTMNHFLSPPKSLSEISDFSHTQTTSIEDLSESGKSIPGVESLKIKTTYDMSFLRSKAQGLSENLQIHSEKILSRKSKPIRMANPEPRTPLKNVTMYTERSSAPVTKKCEPQPYLIPVKP